MTDIITAIAYREDSIDTCRGCVMGTESSNFEVLCSNDPEAITAFVARVRTDDLESLGSHEFSYLINGRLVNDGGGYIQENVPDDIDYDILETREQLIYKIIRDTDAQVATLVQQRKEAKKKAERARVEQVERQRKANEIAQLKRLKAQYPDA